MRAYLTEFIGTFFLVLTIGLSGSPLAIGAGLMAMVYLGGHISGAHYNPAVTLAVFLRGKLMQRDILPYLIAQFAGAIAASLMIWIITRSTPAPAPNPNVSVFSALLIEILFTFALALVILNVATASKTEGNSYYGLAIGFTVLAAAVAGGPISGGAFNPAVGIGMILVHLCDGGSANAGLWIYLVGPAAGGALAAIVFRYQNEFPLPAVPVAAPAGPKEALSPEL
jgi:aquaporin Z